ncbi:fungal hydrophobin [Suillus paluster]|uniref:fungal hydrophobin n=1 Tax=Suillus paluster TaxID=48578 RepID=UPI001B879724|nr:fungal hydrophobin [Suillus paluster]KAG1738121.1 fungal hydrophobin [Suillus paluster]
MFARLFAVASLVAFAVATDGQCNTGNIQCCEGSSSVSDYNSAYGALGVAPIITSVVGDVGLNCSPLTVIGTGSACQANQQPLCCSNNKYNGAINIGCFPYPMLASRYPA